MNQGEQAELSAKYTWKRPKKLRERNSLGVRFNGFNGVASFKSYVFLGVFLYSRYN